MTRSNASESITWDVQIPIGLVLQAQLSTGDPRFKCRYLGMKPGEFLILQMPGVPGLREKLISRCNLILRFLISGKIYGFRSTVLSHTLRPAPLLFISFPSALETVNLRKSERIETFIECEAEIDDQIVRGVVLDLSAEGCKISIEHLTHAHAQLIQPETPLQLRFFLGSSTHELLVSGEIVTTKTDNESSEAGVRFLFEQSRNGTEEQIKHYVKNVLHFKSVG